LAAQQLHTTSKQHESKQTIWRLQPKTVESKPHCATTQLSATPEDVTACSHRFALTVGRSSFISHSHQAQILHHPHH